MQGEILLESLMRRKDGIHSLQTFRVESSIFPSYELTEHSQPYTNENFLILTNNFKPHSRRESGQAIKLPRSAAHQITYLRRFCVARITDSVSIGGRWVYCCTRCCAAEVPLIFPASRMLNKRQTCASRGSVAASIRRRSCRQQKIFCSK